jgi:hypothetical protein
MPTKQEQKQRTEQESRDSQSALAAVIRENVMNDLGRPTDLYQVQVCPLWNNNYRVNVFVGANAACVKVAHSFFLAADGDGKVLDSTPRIAKRY